MDKVLASSFGLVLGIGFGSFIVIVKVCIAVAAGHASLAF